MEEDPELAAVSGEPRCPLLAVQACILPRTPTCAKRLSMFSLGIRTWSSRRKPLSVWSKSILGPMSPTVIPRRRWAWEHVSVECLLLSPSESQ